MNDIINLIDTYGIYIIFVIVLLEYACFPLPSEVVLPLTGAIGYTNGIPLVLLIIITSVCGIIGSSFCYLIGYLGKKSLFKEKEKTKEESKNLYDRFGNFAVSIGRVIPICRTYISFIAGGRKHPFWSFLLFSLLGIIAWNTLLISLGYIFYDNIEIVASFYSKYKIIILSLIAIIILFVIIFKIKNKKQRLRVNKH